MREPRDEPGIEHYDAVVVGAGLGGLSAGMHLAGAGLRVALIESAHRVGGLCGTHWIDGREYVIACNDFGKAMPRWLKAAGAPVAFSRCSTRILHRNRWFSLPPDLRTIGRLLPHLGDVWRYARGLRAAKAAGYRDHASLGALVDAVVRDPMVADLLKLPGYLMGVSPQRLRLDALNHEFEYGYGYAQPMTPDGGPQAMADAMADLVRRNGSVRVGTRYLRAEPLPDGGHRVQTDHGVLLCRHLVEATGEEPDDTVSFPRGLPLSMFCMTLSSRFRYPKGVHTCVYYPPGVSQWFSALEHGELPEDFGFHVFPSHLSSSSPDEYGLNLYLYLPEGQDAPDEAMLARVERRVFDRLDTMLPGLREAVIARHFVSAQAFRERHGLSSRVLPTISPAGFDKPSNYDASRDVFRAGAAFDPPGDHGSAAVLSGRRVAERIGRVRREAGLPWSPGWQDA